MVGKGLAHRSGETLVFQCRAAGDAETGASHLRVSGQAAFDVSQQGLGFVLVFLGIPLLFQREAGFLFRFFVAFSFFRHGMSTW